MAVIPFGSSCVAVRPQLTLRSSYAMTGGPARMRSLGSLSSSLFSRGSLHLSISPVLSRNSPRFIVRANTDIYSVLGVLKNATKSAIRSAYIMLTGDYKPEVNNDPVAQHKFMERCNAYEVLSDVEKRSLYDRIGEAGLKGDGMGMGLSNTSSMEEYIEVLSDDEKLSFHDRVIEAGLKGNAMDMWISNTSSMEEYMEVLSDDEKLSFHDRVIEAGLKGNGNGMGLSNTSSMEEYMEEDDFVDESDVLNSFDNELGDLGGSLCDVVNIGIRPRTKATTDYFIRF